MIIYFVSCTDIAEKFAFFLGVLFLREMLSVGIYNPGVSSKYLWVNLIIVKYEQWHYHLLKRMPRFTGINNFQISILL